MANPDLEEVLNALLPFAQEMLAKSGEFYPFGATMNAAGEVSHVAGHTGDEHPSSQEVIDFLVKVFRERASRGEIKAAGICLDVRTIPPGKTEKTNAICVRLEHAEGEAVDAFLPYEKGRFGKVKYSELYASRGENNVFSSAAEQ